LLSVDIFGADLEEYPCFKNAKFIDVEVRGGDLLYLPAFWWHQVHSDGRSLAVNLWYDVHSLMLKQMMKTLDLNVPLKKDDQSYTRQGRW
jgi:ribosomal protein L16 Arg81 hydroxylase